MLRASWRDLWRAAIDRLTWRGYNRAVEHSPPLRRDYRRWDDLLWVGAAAGVIVVAFLLTPAEEGYGTHQQLFLPPCVFRLLARVGCPLCGMTTSFCHMARADMLAALRANILGPAAALLLLGQIPFRLTRLLGRPIRTPQWWRRPWLIWAGLGLIVLSWPVNVCLQLLGR